MEGLVHSDTHINFAIHGEDRESEINNKGGEVETQEIGAVNDGRQRVQSGAPAFGIGAGSDEQMPVQEGAPAFGICAGNDEQVPAVAAAPGFPIGAFNYRVWQEPDDEYIIDDSEAPGFGIQAGNDVDWQRHGEWHQDIDDIIDYIINDGGARRLAVASRRWADASRISRRWACASRATASRRWADAWSVASESRSWADASRRCAGARWAYAWSMVDASSWAGAFRSTRTWKS
jgi:hypothetical protein